MDANFGGGMAIGWIVWLLIVVLFWGLVIAAIVLGIRWLIRADRRGSHEGPATPDALELLRQRYARGEIDEAEYERRKIVLKGRLREGASPNMRPRAHKCGSRAVNAS